MWCSLPSSPPLQIIIFHGWCNTLFFKTFIFYGKNTTSRLHMHILFYLYTLFYDRLYEFDYGLQMVYLWWWMWNQHFMIHVLLMASGEGYLELESPRCFLWWISWCTWMSCKGILARLWHVFMILVVRWCFLIFFFSPM
jgi:hypothetical protein